MSQRPQIVERALRCFALAAAAEADQREREKEDLRFQVPDHQWPDEVRRQRMATTVNGIPIPARPMLSIPKLDQPIRLVLNQERGAHLGVTVHPLNEDADDETAEVLQGLYRRIEVDSRANLARSWAFNRAVKVGRGYYRILTDYDPNASDASDQRILIKRILEQGRVFMDPFAQEPDLSDAEWGLIIDDMPWNVFKRRFPEKAREINGSAIADFGNNAQLPDALKQWVSGDDEESRTIRVAEFFSVDYAVSDDKGERDRSVKWTLLTAFNVLDERDWPGQWIPIIPVIGEELIPFDGKRYFQGIIGPNKDAQRLFNYAASGSVEMSALETKASHAVDPRAIEGFESWWQQKNLRNFPYLPYTRFLNGQDLGPPEPIQADMSKMQVNAILLQQAGEFIHAGTGAYEPTLGQNSPQVKSGKQALALQQQHDQSNSNWLDSLAEISMTHEARVVLDLIPKIYDRPGRVARILGKEDTPKMVMLNQPYVEQQGKPQPIEAGDSDALPEGAKHYDLTKGRYGVTVSIGKGYKSRLEAGNDALTNLMQAEPMLVPVVGPEWAKFQDFPGHTTIQELLKKWRDHQFPFLADPNEHPDVMGQASQAIAENQALKQQLAAAAQMLQGRTLEKRLEIEGKKDITLLQESAETQRRREDNETKLAVAELSAKVDRLALFLEERARLGTQQHDAAHDVALEQVKHAHAMQQGAQQAQIAAQQADQQAQNASAQSAQDHAQNLEAGDQDAANQIAVAQSQPQENDANA